jgi:citrate lyase subunit beta/citryl-CoA lyase
MKAENRERDLMRATLPDRPALERVFLLSPGAALPAQPGCVLLDLTVGKPEAAWSWASEVLRKAGYTFLVRVHPLQSSETDADLEAVMPYRPFALVLPEGEGAHDLLHLGAKLAVAEAEAGIEDGATRIVLQLDSAAGVLALPTLSGARSRLAALAWVPETIASGLGSTEALAHARSMTLLAASALLVPALDWSGSRDGSRPSGFAGWLQAEG